MGNKDAVLVRDNFLIVALKSRVADRVVVDKRQLDRIDGKKRHYCAQKIHCETLSVQICTTI